MNDNEYKEYNEEYWSNCNMILIDKFEFKEKNHFTEELNSTLVHTSSSFLGQEAIKNHIDSQNIIFQLYPELYITLLICQELKQNEAYFIGNVKKFSNYSSERVIKFENSLANGSVCEIIAMDPSQCKPKS